VVERDAAGDLPTNADLDECHGRTSPILLDGEVVTMYHYRPPRVPHGRLLPRHDGR
jgi:hypothetical protein